MYDDRQFDKREVWSIRVYGRSLVEEIVHNPSRVEHDNMFAEYLDVNDTTCRWSHLLAVVRISPVLKYHRIVMPTSPSLYGEAYQKHSQRKEDLWVQADSSYGA